MTEIKTLTVPAGLPAEPMKPEPFRIRRVIQETLDTFTLELVSTISGRGMAYEPGQFNMLYIFGIGEIPISISGDPSNRSVLVHTTRAVGTVTRAMAKLRKDDVIGVRGPFGTAWPVETAKGNDVVIVAGGIGLAPLRPMIYRILEYREHYGRIVLLYGARTPEDILFEKELQAWGGRFDFDVGVTVDRATGNWNGHVGVVPHLVTRAGFDPQNTTAVICGPEIMMRYTMMAFEKRGVTNENIYVSMERNMKCAVGFCGHCQYGPTFICKDGPVFSYDTLEPYFLVREI